jgi:hypothetical protein
MEVLNYLESQLPPESHVILMGLIDGSVLYQAMAKRIHPLGLLKGDLVGVPVTSQSSIYTATLNRNRNKPRNFIMLSAILRNVMAPI